MNRCLQLLILAWLCIAGSLGAHGQTPASAQPDTVISMSVPFELPLSAYVMTPPRHLNQSDSVKRAMYQRLKVRSITKLQLRQNGRIDSVQHTTLDRQGNEIATYTHSGQSRTHRQFDARGRVTQQLQLPASDYPMQFRYVTRPDEGASEAYSQQTGFPEKPVMRSTQRRQGDTLVQECQLLEPLVMQGQPVHRIVGRFYQSAPDTNRLDVLGYNDAGTVITSEYLFYVGPRKQPRASGVVRYTRAWQALLDTSALARRWQAQGISPTASIARLRFRLRPTFSTLQAVEYDRNGYAISTQRWPLSEKPKLKKITQEGNGWISVNEAPSSVQLLEYDKYHRVTRETWKFQAPEPADDLPHIELVQTDKTYSPKGLLLTETSQTNQQQPARYEYHYTYF